MVAEAGPVTGGAEKAGREAAAEVELRASPCTPAGAAAGALEKVLDW